MWEELSSVHCYKLLVALSPRKWNPTCAPTREVWREGRGITALKRRKLGSGMRGLFLDEKGAKPYPHRKEKFTVPLGFKRLPHPTFPR